MSHLDARNDAFRMASIAFAAVMLWSVTGTAMAQVEGPCGLPAARAVPFKAAAGAPAGSPMAARPVKRARPMARSPSKPVVRQSAGVGVARRAAPVAKKVAANRPVVAAPSASWYPKIPAAFLQGQNRSTVPTVVCASVPAVPTAPLISARPALMPAISMPSDTPVAGDFEGGAIDYIGSGPSPVGLTTALPGGWSPASFNPGDAVTASALTPGGSSGGQNFPSGGGNPASPFDSATPTPENPSISFTPLAPADGATPGTTFSPSVPSGPLSPSLPGTPDDLVPPLDDVPPIGIEPESPDTPDQPGWPSTGPQPGHDAPEPASLALMAVGLFAIWRTRLKPAKRNAPVNG